MKAPQETRNVPEDKLAEKLTDDWLPNVPPPRTILMTRQADGSWTVRRTYD